MKKHHTENILSEDILKRIFSFRALVATGFISIMVAVTACMVIEQNPVTGKNRALGYTWQQEVELGRDADQQIMAEYGVYDDPELDRYVTKVAEEVLEKSHMRREDTAPEFRNTEFTFRVLNSEIVNAFALPGGYIYVTRGLLSHLNNEAQLAVVLGHEIAHVAARHASQRAMQQQAGSLLLVGGVIVGQEVFGASAENILNIGGTAAQLLFLSYSRENERESDRLGVEYAAMHGYDASEASSFFTTLKRLSAQSGGSLPNHLSSHPDPGDREQSMHDLSRIWAERGMNQTIVNESGYLSKIEGIIIGQNPREGFKEGSMFYHPDLELQFPVPYNWELINQTSQVVLYQAEQKAISIFSFASGVSSAQEAVEKITSQEGIEVTTSNRYNVNNLPGHRAIARANDNEGNTLQIMIQAIEYGGNIYQFLSYSLASDFSSFEPNFNLIVNGFNRLTDSSILGVQPYRIQLVTADRTGSFESFLPSTLPMGMDKESLAIINQLNLSDVVTRGQILKLPAQF